MIENLEKINFAKILETVSSGECVEKIACEIFKFSKNHSTEERDCQNLKCDLF